MRRLLLMSVVLALMLSPEDMLGAEEEPPPSGSFSPAGSLAQARAEHTAVGLVGGQVLVVGGIAVTAVDPMSVEVLASAEVWVRAPPRTESRRAVRLLTCWPWYRGSKYPQGAP